MPLICSVHLTISQRLNMRLLVLVVSICSLVPESLEICPNTKSSPKCLCITETDIDCSNRISGSIVPDYVPHLGELDRLNLNNNSITTIGADDFVGTNPHIIDLSFNKISFIDQRAFTPLTKTEELRIRGNNLLILGDAFKELPLVSLLDVRDNSETDSMKFQDDVMKELGDTIKHFYFGHAQLGKWPDALDHFQGLENLTLEAAGAELQIIPPEAFKSFRSTLLRLTIRETRLKAVPLGIGSLRRLDTLFFDDNHDVGDEGIIIQALFQGVNASTIKVASFVNDNLTKFPRALYYMRALKTLNMSQNTLEYISVESVEGLDVTSLILENCGLERIPGVLKKLELVSLDVSNNKIVNVERNDIEAIQKVTDLDLSNNPLQNIVSNAFTVINELEKVDLSSTSLGEVPLALRADTSIKYVDLSNNNIECMCENIWLASNLQNYSMTLDGDCGNIYQSLCYYVKNFIPDCPAYNSSTPLLTFNCKAYVPPYISQGK